ncbi:hypothetical protein, partial [Gilvimarinus sp. 1_MG-2023]|uniref:hypothetical protein n=1 Tax=Gilvimarinus sp. 1_MG-2023 TaxID=3062638 RepID=UPI0026E2A5CA
SWVRQVFAKQRFVRSRTAFSYAGRPDPNESEGSSGSAASATSSSLAQGQFNKPDYAPVAQLGEASVCKATLCTQPNGFQLRWKTGPERK